MFRPKAIILDFDGVITRLDIDWVKIRKEASILIGEKIYSLNEFFERYFGTPKFRLVSQFIKKVELNALEKAVPYADVPEFMTLTDVIPKYIASMQAEEAIMFFLSKHSMAQYFKGVLGRNSFGSKRAQLMHLIESTGLNPKDILYIDDSRRNIEVGKEFGLNSILLRRDRGGTLPAILSGYF